MRRSRGFRSKTRHKLQKVKRPGRSNPITRKIQSFSEGDLVHIIIDPSIHRGQPHPRFHGKTGRVAGMMGRSYVVSIRDGNKEKQLVVRPEHLQMQE
ncbi:MULTISPECIES: 50S ribosomal protein L21e [Methanothermobacter]|uniref:Large ribosomal subunit protein eL21 n=1 Tax=Methanothermobacter marburgensis (strain ATCC BAA-927 / DSM 2133 / JCM 14651 / NBRC 100331 / OCM 82 / Marburg) TaxID=79929 RepID=D9PYI0_METTM|nr:MULTISPECIES: 50S ribosomal protein L21e [Methanothermobacter]ADL59278.1 50S ribosomal protein L21e [Methanothermobacter marburgensis str. Marburg]MCG2828029.1 50S ribosomal protein L21e [Methanothermobacter sp. K4]MDI9614762.1 50S ribosomal protein L21e [Methanothermobacter sp.]QHN07706.1 50S ribosomal protein L21e [Methanothermobacter sp. THM-2]WBF09777.1 50S ribosomal protein L21e [Methanothermobacter marburgensis]